MSLHTQAPLVPSEVYEQMFGCCSMWVEVSDPEVAVWDQILFYLLLRENRPERLILKYVANTQFCFFFLKEID